METRYDLLRNIVGLMISGFLAVLMTGCSKKDSPQIPEDARVEIMSGSLSNYVYQEGAVLQIIFETNYDWTARTDNTSSEWLTVSPMSGGSGKATLSIEVKMNEEDNPRVGNIVISCGKVEKTIEIRQEGNIPTIRLEENNFLVSGDNGGIVELKVRANVGYSMVMPEYDWIKIVNSRGYTTDSYFIEVEPNISDSSRLCVVEFMNKDEGLSCTAEIQQTAVGDKITDISTIELESDGGRVEVMMNYDYAFGIVVKDADWIHTNEYSDDSRKIILDVDENNGKSARTALISVTGGNITHEIKVKQFSKFNVGDSDIDDMPVEEWK